ncbi:MAG: hypothetical protein GWN53_17320 [Gammaproteobacteria bacterium]|uniref:Fibronectin type-III domain-containing protein n=1 Tax=Candidatus Kutchimonas denitrificans TaxID=3056748 RepID=A0AAE4ZAH1_9BACT|nr:hypothetical protein [Candidatus Kutchimonas denitrificans]NIV53603.1 hypothetical protein [Gammaproteobacteria bacterium]
MAEYGVIHRVTVYSGVSNSVQLFQMHSRAGLTNPYLSNVRITGRRITVPENTAAPGEARFTVLDKRNAAGDQTDRFLTQLLGDSEGRFALRNSRIEVDISDDDGQTYQREFTGRVFDVKQTDEVQFEVVAGDLRMDELDEIFDGTVPDVDWAFPPVLLPMGTLSGHRYGPVRAYHRRLLGEWKNFAAGGLWSSSHYIQTVGEVNAERRPPTAVYSDALREHAAYTKKSPEVSIGPSIAPDLRVRWLSDGEAAERDFTVGVVAPTVLLPGGQQRFTVIGDPADGGKVDAVAIEPLSTDDTAPSAGTLGRFYIYSVAPPTSSAPLHIGTGTSNSGVAWPTVVSGIAYGKFGGRGFAVDDEALNTLIQDTSQPKLRFRVTEGPVSAARWLEENVWPVVGYAPAITASGELLPVTYDLPDSTAGLLTLDDTNLIDARWTQTKTGQINHVRFETVRETRIPTTRAQPSDPVDLIQESDNDRIIIAQDAGKKRRQFRIVAKGFRPTTDDASQLSARKKAEERGLIILDRFQDGPRTVRLTVRRTSGTKTARVGDHVLIDGSWLPNLETQVRGGQRLMLITEKGLNPDGTYTLLLLDAGPDQNASSPTVDGLDKNTTDGKHAYDITITPPGDDERAVVQIATVPSGDPEPATDSELWQHATSISGSAQQTVTINELPSRRTHWFRARGQGPGKIPTSWTTALSGTTDSILPPSNLSATISGTMLRLTWTVGDTDYPVMPVLDGEDFLPEPLNRQSTRFIFTELDASTSYTPGVKHVDRFGGDSTTTTTSDTTSTGTVLKTPKNFTVRQGRGDTDPGSPISVAVGTGIEVGWHNAEHYTGVVVHHDTDSNFTSPTAISGIKGTSKRISFPMDDTTRYFRAFHQRPGWGTSFATPTISAKPVHFDPLADPLDGFAGGSAGITSTSTGRIILHVGTQDPDADRFYYEIDKTTPVEPTTSSSVVHDSEMPFSEDSGVTIAGSGIAYLWGKFWNRTNGFGQGVQQSIGLDYDVNSLGPNGLEDLVLNGGFEDGWKFWVNNGTGTGRLETGGDVISGSTSMELEGPAGGGVHLVEQADNPNPDSSGGTNTKVRVQPSGFLHFIATGKVSGASVQADVGIRTFDESGNQLSAHVEVINFDGETTAVTKHGNWEIGANVHFVRVAARIQGDDTEQFWVDDIHMIRVKDFREILAARMANVGARPVESTVTGGSVLSAESNDTGTCSQDATITMEAHDIQFPFGASGKVIQYNKATATLLSCSEEYIVFFDDPTYEGGNVTLQTRDETVGDERADVVKVPGRIYVGKITTPPVGGGGTGGDDSYGGRF